MNNQSAMTTKQRKKVSRIGNTIAFMHYFSMLKGLAMVRGEWNEMPEEINIDYVNEMLLERDLVFFKDEDLDAYVALDCILEGGLDVYGVPMNRIAHGLNGYTKMLTRENSVLIKCAPVRIEGNRMVTPIEAIRYYAQQLAEIDRTMVVNIKRNKTPWVMQADPKLLLTIERMFEDVDENVPVIPVDTDFGKLVQILNTQATFIAPQLYALKQSVMQEALMRLGITNSSIEKRERVNTREVEANNAGTVMYRYLTLDPIVRACKEINKKFGLNVSYQFRNNVDASIDGTNDYDGEESEEVIDDDTESLS